MDKIRIITVCPKCNGENTVEVFPSDYARFINGEGLVQRIFHYLSPAEREMLITGLCDSCFHKIFDDDE